MRKVLIGALSAFLVAAPVAAQVERASAPVEGESELAGAQGVSVLIGALVVAAGVILLVEDDTPEPVSP